MDSWEGAESKLAGDEGGQYPVAVESYSLGNAGTIKNVYNDGVASTVPLTITISSNPTTDTYSRSHGASISVPLPVPWWPPYQSGYEFMVTGTAFTFNYFVWGLDPGSHYVEEAASGFIPSYAWHSSITISVNGAIYSGQQDVDRYTHLRVYFNT